MTLGVKGGGVAIGIFVEFTTSNFSVVKGDGTRKERIVRL